jgi:hypothetical protein
MRSRRCSYSSVVPVVAVVPIVHVDLVAVVPLETGLNLNKENFSKIAKKIV